MTGGCCGGVTACETPGGLRAGGCGSGHMTRNPHFASIVFESWTIKVCGRASKNSFNVPGSICAANQL